MHGNFKFSRVDKVDIFLFEIWFEADDGTTLGVCDGDGCCSEGVLSFSADFGCSSRDVCLVVGQEVTSRDEGRWEVCSRTLGPHV